MVAPTVGSQVSHYRLERLLGIGGMGQVFLARDLTLDRPVAIKFLIAPQDEHARRRLLAEARAAAALDHPSICTVHAVVTDDEYGDFIVMAYVEGETLGTRLSRGRLTPTETMALMAPLLQALGTAHRAGVIHRDIKPHNIVLTPTGLPKLLDFGIATRVVPESSGDDSTTVSQSTGAGDVVGTLAYMSPEQVQGRPVDARSDLFSLGSVLYECLTGRRTFAGYSQAETIGQLLHVDPPPPSTIVEGLDPSYDLLCADMLRKVPAERFQTAEEVLGAMRGYSPTQRTSTAAVRAAMESRPSRRRWGLIAAAAVVVALIGAGWLWRGNTALPDVDPGALRHYETGVEKLREGSYTGARSALMEAVRISPDFVQALLRLAEARAELDDGGGAQEALLRVNALMPLTSRLPAEDQLRLDALRSSVLRDHERAVSAYQQLADLAPQEASRWLDVGRAEEAAGRRVAAMAHFEKAVSLDGQYAAAHQRLGVLQSQGGRSPTALQSLDEAIRLHRVNSNLEGEAEATLRKATVHIARRELAVAGTALARVTELAADPMYLSLRLRAQFEQARVAQFEGRVAEAESLARTALEEAMSMQMGTIAADGLRGLATTLIVAGKLSDADELFQRAIAVAVEQKAGRAEMQARLQHAALRLAENRYADAIQMVEAPLQYFTDARYVRNEAEARSILARAHEGLENYDDARRMASDVLALAESLDDPVLTGVSLDNLAGQSERLGQLPAALAFRERLEKIHRDTNDLALLAFDYVNRADLLVRLGRGDDAEAALAEVDRAIAGGRQDYRGRLPKMSLIRALRASIEGRYAAVEALARVTINAAAGRPSDNALFARLLTEHARARLGRSRVDVAEIAAWPTQASSPALGREMAYWASLTLLERRRPDLAEQVAHTAWAAPPAKDNVELRWRLAALESPSSATMRTSARDDLQSLIGTWAAHSPTYLARPDLTPLRKGIE
jgi:tetratricopeptide (TPR) repeat protein